MKPLYVDATRHARRVPGPDMQLARFGFFMVLGGGLPIAFLTAHVTSLPKDRDGDLIDPLGWFLAAMIPLCMGLAWRLGKGVRLPSFRIVSGFERTISTIRRALSQRARDFDAEAGWPVLRRRFVIWVSLTLAIILFLLLSDIGEKRLLGRGPIVELSGWEIPRGYFMAAAPLVPAALVFFAWRLANPRTRSASVVAKVWLLRLAGLAVVAAGLGAAALSMFGLELIWGDLRQGPEYVMGIVAALLLGILWVGWLGVSWCWELSGKLGLATEHDIRRSDGRRPAVLLRSFQDDQSQVEVDKSDDLGWTSLEIAVHEPLARFGPFIAIGEPGQLPEPGAARASVADQHWRSKVIQWIDDARVVVVVAGWTDALMWELSTIIERGHAGKLILLLPASRYRRERWERVCSRFATTPWHAALRDLDIAAVRAIYLAPHGPVAINSKNERIGDYEVAVELALYGMLCSRLA